MAATPSTNLGFQNFFSATLTGDITSTSTDILLDAIPNATEGFLVIEPDSVTKREVIFYTSKTALKVVCPSAADGRGQDDTTATSHTTGSAVILAPVAAYYEALQSGLSISDNVLTSEKLKSTVAFKAYRTLQDQTINTSTITTLQLSLEAFDVGNDYDTSTYTFTCPYDGIYHFEGQLMIDATGGQCLAYIYVNGVSKAEDNNYNTVASDDTCARVSATLQCSAGDAVTFRGHHNAGAGRVLLASQSATYFSGFLVGRI